MLLQADKSLMHARVNTFFSALLVGCFALWAGVTIWQTATGTNPIAKAFVSMMQDQLELRY
ncbi:MAG: hypothetical protein AAB449_02950 [Patescibacteria group bacterium]